MDSNSRPGSMEIGERPINTGQCSSAIVPGIGRPSRSGWLTLAELKREYTARQVVDFCLDLGEAMLSAGSDASNVTAAIEAVSGTWSPGLVRLDFPGESLYLVCEESNGVPAMGFRLVPGESADLHRLNNIYRLVDDIVRHKSDMKEARRRLTEQAGAGPRWPYCQVACAMGVLGIVIALQAGGTWRSGAGAFFLMVVLLYIGRFLMNLRYPIYFAVAGQAALATVVGGLAMAFTPITPGEAASMLAACVVLLLPHPSIVTMAQDAVSGFRGLALSRGVGVGLVVLGVSTGIPAGIAMTRWADIEVDPTAIRLTSLPWSWALLASAIAALANAVAQGATARVIPTAVVAAIATQSIVQVSLRAQLSPQLSLILGAAALAAGCSWIAARLAVSAVSIIVPAFCGALLPALSVAHSLLQFIADAPGSGSSFVLSVLTTFAIGVGLAAGRIPVGGWPGARQKKAASANGHARRA